MKCQGCLHDKNNTTKLVVFISDDQSPYERKHIVNYCPRCLADERRLASYAQSTPPGFQVFVQYVNGAWQRRRYIYADNTYIGA